MSTVWLSETILDRSRVNAWERIQSDPELDWSQIYPVPCKRGLNTLSTPNTVEGIVSKYPSVFNGVEKLKNFHVKFILISQ